MLSDRKITHLGWISVAMITMHSITLLPATAEPALPEDVAMTLIDDLSNKLAIKLNTADCPAFNEILDDAQSDAANRTQQSAVIMQMLEDVKTNPNLRTIVLTKLSEPLLQKTLDCNLVPVAALGSEAEEIQDITELSTALTALLSRSDCPAFNQILDDAQAEAMTDDEDDSSTGVSQLLTDAKTDLKSQSVIINALGNPLLNKTLDCNLIPFSALR